MAANTSIEWCDDTVNFWTGCTQVSPACDHCYAMELAKRFNIVAWNGKPKSRALKGMEELRASDRRAKRQGRKRFVFLNSMSDTFDKQADEIDRGHLFATLDECEHLIGLVLTKRIGNVDGMSKGGYWPANAWLGITVVNQQEADRDIPKLLAAKSALGIPRAFLSVEPMLGPVDLNPEAGASYRRLSKWYGPNGFDETGEQPERTRRTDLFPKIDWVICGGESGAKARPMHPDWARSLRDQCAAAGVPFHFKQWGEWAPDLVSPHFENPLRDGRTCKVVEPYAGCDISEERLMIRLGKKAAGRILDAVEHNGRPQP